MAKRKRTSASSIIDCADCPYCTDPKSQEEIIALSSDHQLPHVIGSDHADLQFQISDFVVHAAGKVCSLEDGLVERGEQVYVCGTVSSLFDDQAATGLAVKAIGRRKDPTIQSDISSK